MEELNSYADPFVLLELVLASERNQWKEGFTPEFREGYRAIGIVATPSEIEEVGEGRVKFRSSFRNRFSQAIYELPGPIVRVYRQLTPEERGYRVL